MWMLNWIGWLARAVRTIYVQRILEILRRLKIERKKRWTRALKIEGFALRWCESSKLTPDDSTIQYNFSLKIFIEHTASYSNWHILKDKSSNTSADATFWPDWQFQTLRKTKATHKTKMNHNNLQQCISTHSGGVPSKS